MDLNDYRSFAQLDPQNMLGEIDLLPDQLEAAWELGQRLPLPAWEGIERVVIAGMGGSAIGADLLAAYALPKCAVPVFIHRDYDLPAWARGPRTLAIISSHSGNTEETLTAFEKAIHQGCLCLSIATGGKLTQDSRAAGVPVWNFAHGGQPRAAVGYSFGLLLAVFTRLRLIPDPSAELDNALFAMRRQQQALRAEVSVAENPAKRLAGQLLGRWIVVFGAGILAPVARRWKGQFNEIAKAWAQCEFLPEADHNTLAGTQQPAKQLDHAVALFLQSSFDHPRNRLRSEFTRKALMVEGFSTDFFEAKGDTPLAHLWTLLHFGDYTSYYLAMLYGVDPTPIAALAQFKEEMSKA